MKRLFLSFSVTGDSEGREFVRRLFDRLQQQAIDPWVFESPRGEIAAGQSISDSCRRKIEESDVFVVFITDRALKSDYVQVEVSHALWDGGRRTLPIVPLMATRTLRNDWPPAVAEATGFKGIVLPTRPLDALEAVVVHICETLHIDYRPPAPTAVRLPLRNRLAEELQSKSSMSGYEAGDFIAVLRKCDLTVEAMGREDYERARRLVEAILTDLELQYGITQPYYPRVVYGAILLADAHAGRRSFSEVERYFAALIAEKSDRLDANAFAGRANALMALERFEEALMAYEEAESYLESPDAALFYNMIRARALGALGMDRAEIRRRRAALDAGIVTRIPGDLARLMSSVALAYAYTGEIEAAAEAWRDIREIESVFPEIVVDIGHHIYRHATEGQAATALEMAHDVIREYLSRRTDLSDFALLPLRHLLARVSFEKGDTRTARRELARLIGQFERTPVLHIDAAMFALGEGDLASAGQLCEAVVSLSDPSQCHPPLSPREFNFALGHAFWLLGRCSEARESFRRTEYCPSLWYERTMPGDFARLRYSTESTRST